MDLKTMKKNRFLIFQPPKSAMQSGLLNTKKWCLTNCEMNESFINSRFCWLGSSNPERQIRLFFDTLDSAERFAKKNKYKYEIQKTNKRHIIKKSYAKNFIKRVK